MNFSFDQRKAGILLGVVLVAGIAVYFTQQAADKKEQEGKNSLYLVEKTYEEELKAVPDADRQVGTTLEVDSKFPKTVSGLNEILAAKKAPSRVLYEAGIKLGTLYLDHNQSDKAIGVLKGLKTEASSSFQKASLYYLLGTTEERASQYKDALDSYQSGLSSNVDGLKGELLLGMVRTSLKLNDKEKAKLYFEKMNKEVAGTRPVQVATELLKGNQS